MKLESFRAAMHAAGIDYAGPIHADGKLRRVKSETDKARDSWFVLFPGPPSAGSFGSWRLGLTEKWCEREPRSMSPVEWNRVREDWKRAAEARDISDEERRTEARTEAARILANAKPAEAHAYLEIKAAKVFGDVREHDGKLVLPLRDATGELHSVQRIGADGAKKFLTGGRVAGCFFTLCDKADGPLVICEGYATGASVHAATGFAAVAAMNAGNLKTVAEALRAKDTAREIIIAADDDRETRGNPGLTKATEAAKAIAARLAVPKFKDISDKPTDFNDLATSEGLDAVKVQVGAAEAPKETDAETLSRLAKLPAVEYDRTRDSEAERLGIRAATLDKQVAALRPKSAGKDNAQGFAVELPEVEPWPDPVDGAEVLREAAAVFSRYVFLPDGAADALALWTAHAHCFDAFIHSPRLNLRSAEKGCGKTTLLDVLASLSPRAMRTENMTSAVLFRVIDRHRPVLLLDETDAYLNDNEELRGLLNAGHRRGARAYRVEGENLDVRGFNAFAPAVLAGIGGLTGKLSTLHDRSVVVDLVRAKPGEITARFDSRRTAHETELCRKLARWTRDNFDRFQNSDPTLPSGAFNRLADNWRVLFAIAEAAGGEWPRRAADAFAKLTSAADVDAQGVGATLLADIAEIFARGGVDRLPSARLCGELAAIEGRPWAEWGRARKPISTNQLANQLRRFNVAPRTIRVGDDTPRGYDLADFKDCFERFSPSSVVSGCNTATEAENIGDSAVSRVQQLNGVFHPEKSVSANKDGACCGVAVQKPEPAEMLL